MQERDVIDLKRGGCNAVRAAHYPQDPAFLAACDKYGLLVVDVSPDGSISRTILHSFPVFMKLGSK